MGPFILVFLVGVMAVGVAGAFYKVNKAQPGYRDNDDVAE